jgi:hypothetical protein
MTNGESNGQMVTVPRAGEVARQEFGGSTLEVRGETSASAMAAQAKAAVESAYIMAMRRPRDIDQVRVRLLKACSRPVFADAARYERPVGKEKNEETGQWEDKIAEGLSIRFAEEAARNMGNLDVDSITLYDDARRKIVKFYAIDLETNTKWAKTITIEKIKEQRNLRKGQQAVGERINSYGDRVFIVEATPDDVTKKEGAEGSKAWRDQILRHVPADIKEECLQKIRQTVTDQAAKDPEGEKKKILDAFAGIGVEPVQLKEYVGHDLATLSPSEIVTLRGVFTAIRDGQVTWTTVLDQRRETTTDNGNGKKETASTPTTATPPVAQPAAQTTATVTPPSEKPAEPPKGQQGLAAVAAASRAGRQRQMTVQVEQPDGTTTTVTPPAEREPGGDDDK